MVTATPDARQDSRQDPWQVAELLCARLCHDLSGPLGALLGALELAAEEAGGDQRESLDVAGEAADALGRRLRLLRVAWGGEAEPLDVAAFRRLAAGATAGRRVTLDADRLDAAAAFTAAGGRLALNAVLLAVGCVPGGGGVTLAGSPDTEIRIAISGPRAAWPDELAACLAEPAGVCPEPTDPRRVQLPLTLLLASRGGGRLSLRAAIPPAPPQLVLRLRG